MWSGLPLSGLYSKSLDTIFAFILVLVSRYERLDMMSNLLPNVSLCGGCSRLISIIYSRVQVLAGVLSCWALLKDCVSVSCMCVRAVQTGRASPMQEFTADLKHRMRGVEMLSWWTPTHTTISWPLIILGLPPLFLEMMSVRRLFLYHGIFILICPNMLCAM